MQHYFFLLSTQPNQGMCTLCTLHSGEVLPAVGASFNNSLSSLLNAQGFVVVPVVKILFIYLKERKITSSSGRGRGRSRLPVDQGAGMRLQPTILGSGRPAKADTSLTEPPKY